MNERCTQRREEGGVAGGGYIRRPMRESKYLTEPRCDGGRVGKNKTGVWNMKAF